MCVAEMPPVACLFILLFLAMGSGLLMMRRWGLWTFLAGTLAYTLERAAFLLSETTMRAWLKMQTAGLGDLGQLAGLDGLGDLSDLGEVMDLLGGNAALQTTRWTALAMLVCWWGLAFYVWIKRDLFEDPTDPTR